MQCNLGVTSGKLLEFVVQHKGIEIHPTKIKGVMELPPPVSNWIVLNLTLQNKHC